MKRHIDFSKGFLHRDMAHLYLIAAFVALLINFVLLISSKKLATVPIAFLALLFIQSFITLILSFVAFLSKNLRLYKIYAILSIVNITVVAIFVEGIRGALNVEATKLFFENLATVVLNTRNVLPGIVFTLSVVVILSVISVVLIFVSMFLVIKNIHPKPTVKHHVSHEESIEISEDIQAFQEEIKSE